MKRSWLMTAVLGIGLAAGAYLVADAPAVGSDLPAGVFSAGSGSPADVEAGKALYGKFCQKCHGAHGEGVPRMYQLVDAKIVHLGSRAAQAKSDSEIKKAMLEGKGKMEAVDDLEPQQADRILAFERTLTDQDKK